MDRVLNSISNQKLSKNTQGTRLNDLQYFRQPLPHARKKMTCLRIFPSENASPTSKSRLSPAKKRKKKNSNPPTKLDINQPSIEMAVITYTDSQASLQSRQTRETQVSELDFPDILLAPAAAPRPDVSSFYTQTDKPKEKETATSPAPRLQLEEEEEEVDDQRSSPKSSRKHQSALWLKRIFADFFQLLLPGKRNADDDDTAATQPEPKPLKRDSYQRSVGLASLFRSKNDEEAAVTQRILIKGDESLRVAYMNNVALKARSAAENTGRLMLHTQTSCGPLKSF